LTICVFILNQQLSFDDDRHSTMVVRPEVGN
jgi:hypothetical protein